MFPPSYLDTNKIITEKYLNYNNGFYIEVGGADGVTQSNTWHLEMYKKWSGILVEPNPIAAEQCRNNRPNSSVFNYALVGNNFENDTIKMLHRTVYGGDPGLMTSTIDSPIRQNLEWMAPATDTDKTEEFEVQVTTLNDILESQNVTNIDFFSLDVEGYELEVLAGLDLKRFSPKVILVEWHLDFEDIKKVLDATHVYAEQLTKHDYVFLAR
jgi:FkbM family methyltransferase